MNQVMDTAPLWSYLLVRRHIKKVDETYSYLQYRNGYLPLRRNSDWHRLIFPYYKLGKRVRTMNFDTRFDHYLLESIDELSHFFSMFIESEAVEFTIEKDTWWETYQSLYPPEPKEPIPLEKWIEIRNRGQKSKHLDDLIEKMSNSTLPPDPRKPNEEVINQWLGHNNTTKLNKMD